MSTKIVSVVGATGTQGGSVVNALLKSGTYAIRAITRNPESDAAKSLAAKGVELVKADADDLASLTTAFCGSTSIFAVTDFVTALVQGGPEHAVEAEAQQGINLAKAAAATSSLEHYIWSTLPNSKVITGGKIVVPQYESKNRVDAYIKTSETALLAKSTFLVTTSFGESINMPVFQPFQVPGSSQYIQLHCVPDDTPFVVIGNARANIGLFVHAILEQPNKTLPGKAVNVYSEVTTPAELLQTWSKVTGKDAHLVQIDRSTYDALWPGFGRCIALMMELFAFGREKVWASGDGVLNKDDLGIQGLVPLEKTFAM